MDSSFKFNAIIKEDGKTSMKEVEGRDLQEGEILIRVLFKTFTIISYCKIKI